jgi:hypothetical protein
VILCRGCGSRSLAFPAPPHGLGRLQPGPRGVPEPSAAASRNELRKLRLVARGFYPRGLRFSIRAISQPLAAFAAPEGACSPSFVGCPLSVPSAVCPTVRPLPEAEAPFGPMEPSTGISFHPRGFSPPRRLPPHGGRGFVAPRYRLWSSTRFLLPIPVTTGRWFGKSWHFSRSGSHPSKSSLRRQPVRIAAAVAPLPLRHAPCSAPPAGPLPDDRARRLSRGTTGSGAFLRRRIRCDPEPVKAPIRSFLPWAWFPSEVLLHPPTPIGSRCGSTVAREASRRRAVGTPRMSLRGESRRSVPRHPSVGSPRGVCPGG